MPQEQNIWKPHKKLDFIYVLTPPGITSLMRVLITSNKTHTRHQEATRVQDVNLNLAKAGVHGAQELFLNEIYSN